MELALTDRLKRQPSPLLKRRFPRVNLIGAQNLADAFEVDPRVPDTTIVGIRECDINLLLGSDDKLPVLHLIEKCQLSFGLKRWRALQLDRLGEILAWILKVEPGGEDPIVPSEGELGQHVRFIVFVAAALLLHDGEVQVRADLDIGHVEVVNAHNTSLHLTLKSFRIRVIIWVRKRQSSSLNTKVLKKCRKSAVSVLFQCFFNALMWSLHSSPQHIVFRR